MAKSVIVLEFDWMPAWFSRSRSWMTCGFSFPGTCETGRVDSQLSDWRMDLISVSKRWFCLVEVEMSVEDEDMDLLMAFWWTLDEYLGFFRRIFRIMVVYIWTDDYWLGELKAIVFNRKLNRKSLQIPMVFSTEWMEIWHWIRAIVHGDLRVLGTTAEMLQCHSLRLSFRLTLGLAHGLTALFL